MVVVEDEVAEVDELVDVDEELLVCVREVEVLLVCV